MPTDPRYTTDDVALAIAARRRFAAKLHDQRRWLHDLLAKGRPARLTQRDVNNLARALAKAETPREDTWAMNRLGRVHNHHARMRTIQRIDEWIEDAKERMPYLYCGDDDALGERIDDASMLQLAIRNYDKEATT